MPIQAIINPLTSAARLLRGGAVANVFGIILGVLALCLSTATMASQVVGEVTLTIGKSKIERSTQETEPAKGGSVQEGDLHAPQSDARQSPPGQ